MLKQTVLDILNPECLAPIEVMIIGVGSGGSATALWLANTGFSNICLVDPDKLEVRNIYAHVCDMSMVGQYKVDAVKNEIHNINPDCNVTTIKENILEGEEWLEHAKRVKIIVIATDNDESRLYLNEYCVQNNKPFVIAKVFNKGIGGEVYRYLPNETGCLCCLETFLDRIDLSGVSIKDTLTKEEKQEIYKRDIKELKNAPGLILDIAFIPLLLSRLVLDTVLQLIETEPFPYIEHNYLIWSNHAVQPFNLPVSMQRVFLHQNDECKVCRKEEK